MAPKRSPLHTLIDAVTGIGHGAAPGTAASDVPGSAASDTSGPGTDAASGAVPGNVPGAASGAVLDSGTALEAPAVAPGAASPARVSLDAALGREGAVDGGWWPRSRDAAAELPGLIADIDHRLNRPVLRVGLPLESWDDIPHRVAAPGRQVKVGWFRHMDAHTVTLIGANMEPVTLRVIPPDTAEDAAGDALTAAASGA